MKLAAIMYAAALLGFVALSNACPAPRHCQETSR